MSGQANIPEDAVPLEFGQCLCQAHGEPFRETWPVGYPTFIVPLLSELLKSEAFWNEYQGDKAKIPEALKRLPICCRFDSKRILDAYVFSKVGRMRMCVVCRNHRLGTPFRAFDSKGVLQRYKHVCFQCVIYNAEMTRAVKGGGS